MQKTTENYQKIFRRFFPPLDRIFLFPRFEYGTIWVSDHWGGPDAMDKGIGAEPPI